MTPDQKRRIAELDTKTPAEEEKKEPRISPALHKAKEVWLRFRTASWKPVAFKVLLAAIVLCVAGYYIQDYRLYRIDFRKVFSSGPGNPLDRLITEVKRQGKKKSMLEDARAQYVVGDYAASLATSKAVENMDGTDSRAQGLIDLAADAATQRATREFDMGEIEAALGDARLALKYRPEHQEAQQLSLRIGERLFREARVHYSKKEYAQLIRKLQEVIKINPSDVAASSLLMRTNNDLLGQADEFFINKRYFDALDRVSLALKIDPTNSRTLRLFNQISLYIETPEIKLRGITKFGNTPYAIIQLPGSSQTVYVKKGETVRNFKLIDIDETTKTARFLQIYTKAEFSIALSKPE